jgi:alkanesulfonate monooxygenase SsuD/methylene tetrahydromethanopterin reductase-like flavin-dependent oxidoreductase (luciferase family)
MKFALMVDIGRTSSDKTTEQALEETTELVKMADRGGFDLVVCGEHHGHEMTIAPNPLSLLAYWARQTDRIRLGTGVVCAPFWHPIRLAGEAGLVDVISQGRLDLGIGRGAYPYEFARMANGISPEEARESVTELIPALRGLWAGEYEHSGKSWSFPSTTSTPRPVQPGGPPIWVSARHPDMFNVACENRCHVMVNPLDMPFAEVESLRERLDTAVTEADNGWDPQMMVLRQTCVHDGTDPHMPVRYQNERMKVFRTLFDTQGNVVNGFVQPIAGDINRDSDDVAENYMFGTPSQVIDKLKRYESVGTDVFLYGASWGLPHEVERDSLDMFIREVIPAFNRAQKVVQTVNS